MVNPASTARSSGITILELFELGETPFPFGDMCPRMDSAFQYKVGENCPKNNIIILKFPQISMKYYHCVQSEVNVMETRWMVIDC